MGHQDDFESVFQTLYNKLQPSYSITSIADLGEIMVNIGIPKDEVSVITYVFDKLGLKSFIDVEGETTGEGYRIQFYDPGEYLALSRDELEIEIQLLQDEMEAATDESRKISCLRQIAKITGQFATIKFPYQSEEELLEKKRKLSVYIKIAREIVDRS
jgi:hypothetical protein